MKDVFVAIDRLPGVSRMFRDVCGRSDAPVHELLGGARTDARSWTRVFASQPAVDARLVARMQEFNARAGAPPALLERIGRLGKGEARVVVTGQQPGVMGGPLLTLHKLASALAIARALEARHGTPCVPVFWIGSDDDDFAEIRDLTVLGSDVSVLSARMGAEAYRPGLRVGDIRQDAALAAWGAVAALADGGDRRTQAETVVRDSSDLGEATAHLVSWLTRGEVAVLDGRESLLRVCSRDLLLSFCDREEHLRAAVEGRAANLESMGYHAQLALGKDSGLFLLRDGVRQRIPMERRGEARAEFARDITLVSPGVIARNLLQDSVLAPVATVVGPAEIAYRAQIADAYRELGISMPIVVPRLTATFVPPPVGEMVDATGVDPSLLALDALGFVRAARASVADDEFAAAARRFEAEMKEGSARFRTLAQGRLDARERERLDKRLADVLERLAQVLATAQEKAAGSSHARWPFLARMADVFVRDGQAQERYLSLLTPYLACGEGAWDAISALADRHARDTLDGRAWHGVYSA